MRTRLALLPLLLVAPLLPLGACTGTSVTLPGPTGTGAHTTGTFTGGSSSTGGGTASTGGATTTSSSTAGTGGGKGDGGLPQGAAMVRVHYPAGSHTVTVRGSAGGLSWSQGQATM